MIFVSLSSCSVLEKMEVGFITWLGEEREGEREMDFGGIFPSIVDGVCAYVHFDGRSGRRLWEGLTGRKF